MRKLLLTVSVLLVLLMFGCEIYTYEPYPAIQHEVVPVVHYDYSYDHSDDYYYHDGTGYYYSDPYVYSDYCTSNCCYYYEYYDTPYSSYEVCEVMECYDPWTDWYEYVDEVCWLG